MTHTSLFKNEVYLIITSIISIGVLGGYEYLGIALVAILIFPVINMPNVNIFRREQSHTRRLDKRVDCN